MSDASLVKNNPDIANRLSFAVVPFSRSSPSSTQILNLPNGTLAEFSEDEDEGGIANTLCEMPSSINIADSSDVVIGPVTQFHGPVTIMQNTRYPEIPFETKTQVNVQKSPIQKKSLILTLALVVSLILIVVIVIYSVPKTQLQEDTVDVVNSTSDNGPDKLGSHRVIRKNVWGGRPSVKPLRPLKHPTEYVLISHTAGRFCRDISSCSIIMKDSQASHVTSNSPDIGYNFLIGGDGNIYVGRDWDFINFHRNLCIAISFIGNYIYDELTDDMISATKELLAEGVKQGKLSPNYRIVSHNQTTPTISPGRNVYKVIKTWSHFRLGNVVF